MHNRLETVVSGTLLIVAVLFIVFIDTIVAPPKMLLGRSLTAIQPSLFPLIAMGMMIVLTGLFLAPRLGRRKGPSGANGTSFSSATDWKKIGAFFAILILYALMFKPVGFLISTVFAITALSVLAGNRNLIQIAALAVLAPIGLYIVSTRILLISLPELNAIELAYSAILGR